MSDDLHLTAVSPRERTRILAALTEAPFFYRADDRAAFNLLRRHQDDFAAFFRHFFGLELQVRPQLARLYRPHLANPALTPSQTGVLEFSGVHDCLGFLLVLEFYQVRLEADNATEDDDEQPAFAFGELSAFAARRLAELGQAEPQEAARRALRQVMPRLVRWRFLAEMPAPPGADAAGAEEAQWYRCLPGLSAYDIREAGASLLERWQQRDAEPPA